MMIGHHEYQPHNLLRDIILVYAHLSIYLAKCTRLEQITNQEIIVGTHTCATCHTMVCVPRVHSQITNQQEYLRLKIHHPS
jgi:hypothetical protein